MKVDSLKRGLIGNRGLEIPAADKRFWTVVAVVAAPLVVWLIGGVIYSVRANSHRKFNILGRDNISVLLCSGPRSLQFIGAAPLKKMDSNTWTGGDFNVKADLKTGVLFVTSPLLINGAYLKYDGYRWGGFDYTPGRRLPMYVEAW